MQIDTQYRAYDDTLIVFVDGVIAGEIYRAVASSNGVSKTHLWYVIKPDRKGRVRTFKRRLKAVQHLVSEYIAGRKVESCVSVE